MKAVFLALAIGSATMPMAAQAATSSVVVTGRVLQPDGTPARGVPVSLNRQVDAASTIGGAMGSLFSLGLACLQKAVKICQDNSYSVATAADGGFSIGLSPQVAADTLSQHNKFFLNVALPPAPGESAGPFASGTFTISQARLQLPDLHMWRASPKVTGDATTAHVAWTPTSPPASRYAMSFKDGNGVVWSTSSGGSSTDLDARVLEDTRGMLDIETAAGVATGTDNVSISYHSPPAAYSGTAGAPPSRGKPCSLQWGDQASQALSPCLLTDGELGRAWTDCRGAPGTTPTCSGPTAPSPPTCAPTPLPARPTQSDYQRQQQQVADCAKLRRERLVIDLGAAQSVGLVVVRGAPGATVQTSSDARTWTSRGSVRSSPEALKVPAGVHARFVSISSAGPMTGVSEVSVWPSLEPDPVLNGFPLGSPGAPGGAASLVLVLAVLGAIAAGAVYGGIRLFGHRTPPAG